MGILRMSHNLFPELSTHKKVSKKLFDRLDQLENTLKTMETELGEIEKQFQASKATLKFLPKTNLKMQETNST
jgi:regulator of replication initiation timing